MPHKKGMERRGIKKEEEIIENSPSPPPLRNRKIFHNSLNILAIPNIYFLFYNHYVYDD